MTRRGPFRTILAGLLVLLLAAPAWSAVVAHGGHTTLAGDPTCQERRLPDTILFPCFTFPAGDHQDGTFPGTIALEWSVNGDGPWNISLDFDTWYAQHSVFTGPVNATAGILDAFFEVPDNATSPQILEYTVRVERLFPTPIANDTEEPSGDPSEGEGNATAPPEGNQTSEPSGNNTTSTGAAPRWSMVGETRFASTIQIPGQAPPRDVPIGWFVGAGVLVFGLVAGTLVLVNRRNTPVHTVRSKTLLEMEADEKARKRGGAGKVAPRSGPTSRRSSGVTDTGRGDTKGGPAPEVPTGPEAEHPGAPDEPPRPSKPVSTGPIAILEARKADAQKMIDLARSRFERGELSEHQFKLISERKAKELAKIDDEIAALDE